MRQKGNTHSTQIAVLGHRLTASFTSEEDALLFLASADEVRRRFHQYGYYRPSCHRNQLWIEPARLKALVLEVMSKSKRLCADGDFAKACRRLLAGTEPVVSSTGSLSLVFISTFTPTSAHFASAPPPSIPTSGYSSTGYPAEHAATHCHPTHPTDALTPLEALSPASHAQGGTGASLCWPSSTRGRKRMALTGQRPARKKTQGPAPNGGCGEGTEERVLSIGAVSPAPSARQTPVTGAASAAYACSGPGDEMHDASTPVVTPDQLHQSNLAPAEPSIAAATQPTASAVDANPASEPVETSGGSSASESASAEPGVRYHPDSKATVVSEVPTPPAPDAVYGEGYFRHTNGGAGIFDMIVAKDGTFDSVCVGIKAEQLRRLHLQKGDLLAGYVITRNGKRRLLEEGLTILRDPPEASAVSQNPLPPSVRKRKVSLLARKEQQLAQKQTAGAGSSESNHGSEPTDLIPSPVCSTESTMNPGVATKEPGALTSPPGLDATAKPASSQSTTCIVRKKVSGPQPLAFTGVVRLFRDEKVALLRVVQKDGALFLEGVLVPQGLRERLSLQAGQRVEGTLSRQHDHFVLTGENIILHPLDHKLPLPSGIALQDCKNHYLRAREVLGVFLQAPGYEHGFLQLPSEDSQGDSNLSNRVAVHPPIIRSLKLRSGQWVRGLAYDGGKRHMRLFEVGVRTYESKEAAQHDQNALHEPIPDNTVIVTGSSGDPGCVEQKACQLQEAGASSGPMMGGAESCLRRTGDRQTGPTPAIASDLMVAIRNRKSSIASMLPGLMGTGQGVELSLSLTPDYGEVVCAALEQEAMMNARLIVELKEYLENEFIVRDHYNLSPRQKVLTVTLSEGIERFRKEALLVEKEGELELRKMTKSNYLRSLRLIEISLGRFPMQAILPEHLRRLQLFFTQIRSDGVARSNSTINRDFAALSRLFTEAMRRWDVVSYNPVHKLDPLPEPPGSDATLTDQDRVRLVVAVRLSSSPYLAHAFVLCLSTGMRQTEALGLKWGCYDRRRGTLTVLRTTSKNHERKTIPVVGVLKDVLEMRWRDTENHQPGDALFPSVSPDSVYDPTRAWKTALKRANIPNFRWHDLRHTAGSYLAMCGANTRDIQKILGLSTTEMAERYTHLDDGYCRHVMERVSQFFPLLLKGQAFIPEHNRRPIHVALLEHQGGEPQAALPSSDSPEGTAGGPSIVKRIALLPATVLEEMTQQASEPGAGDRWRMTRERSGSSPTRSGE